MKYPNMNTLELKFDEALRAAGFHAASEREEEDPSRVEAATRRLRDDIFSDAWRLMDGDLDTDAFSCRELLGLIAVAADTLLRAPSPPQQETLKDFIEAAADKLERLEAAEEAVRAAAEEPSLSEVLNATGPLRERPRNLSRIGLAALAIRENIFGDGSKLLDGELDHDALTAHELLALFGSGVEEVIDRMGDEYEMPGIETLLDAVADKLEAYVGATEKEEEAAEAYVGEPARPQWVPGTFEGEEPMRNVNVYDGRGVLIFSAVGEPLFEGSTLVVHVDWEAMAGRGWPGMPEMITFAQGQWGRVEYGN